VNSKTVASLSFKDYPDFVTFAPVTGSNIGNVANMTCALNITAPSDKILAFKFMLSSWSTINGTCQSNEYMEIFDGSSTLSSSIYKECKDDRVPPTVFTTGPHGYIELKTGVNPHNTYVFVKIYAVKPTSEYSLK
jgi:hypothetical protein